MKKIISSFTCFLMILAICFSFFGGVGVVSAAEPPAMPAADIAPGLYRAAQQVSLSCETPGTEIYYTTNGLMPDTASAKYTAPISVAENTNICAVAVKDGVQSAPTTFSYIIKGAEEPKLQFVALSDLHVGSVSEKESARVAKEFDVIHSIFPNADAIVMAGDFINAANNATTGGEMHAEVKSLIEQNLTRLGMEQTEVRLAIGNHDAGVEEMKKYYPDRWFPHSEPGYYSTEIKGYNFLFANTEIFGNHPQTETQRMWLREKLDEITAGKTEMNQPIFVVMHKPIPNTVMGSLWADAVLQTYNEDLAAYPQVMTFSGHSHLDMTDERAIFQKDFTSLNTGSGSYIEVERIGALAHTDSGVKVRYEFPVTQALFVEVFENRVEIDRVAMNADWADIKTTGYIPAEPFYNMGKIIGERWTVEQGEGMKEKFQYTASRKAAELSFAAEAKAKLEMSENQLQVTFPQVKNIEKIHHYELRVVNQTGSAVVQEKLLPENVFSPVPGILTYPVQGEIPEGDTVTAEIIPVDAFGRKGAALQAEGSYTKPIPPAEFRYALNEAFDQALTDSAAQIIPTEQNWGGTVAAEVSGGKLNLVHKENKIDYQVNVPLQPGDEKHTTPIPRGRTYVSMNYELNASGKNGLSIRLCDNMGSAGQKPFGVRADIMANSVEVQQNNDSGWVSLGKLESGDFTSGKVKFGIDATAEGVTKIIGVWITPKGGEETLIPNTENAEMGDIGTGLYKLILYPAIGVAADYVPESGTVIGAIDNLKVWESAKTQVAGIKNSTVDFETIKGQNTAPRNVTGDLSLSNAKTTKNDLEILRWESSHPDVIDSTGKVTLPVDNTEVALTPIVKFEDPEQTDGMPYVEAKGVPVTVLVRVKEIIVQGKQYLYETFDKALTDSTTQIIPTVDNWSGKAAAEVSGGRLNIVHQENSLSYQMNVPLQPGTEAEAPAVPRGKTFVSWDWELGEKLDGTAFMLCDRGKNSLGIRLDITPGQVKISAHNDSGYDVLKYVQGDFRKGHVKIGVDSSVQGVSKLLGVWLTPADGEEALADNTENISMGDIGNGFFKLMYYPNKLKADAIPEAGDRIASLDNLKVWEPAETETPQALAWKDAYLTLDGEKISELSAGTFAPEFLLQNSSEEIERITLIAAVYRDNILEEVRSAEYTQAVPSAGNTKVQLEPVTIDDPEAQTVRYFVWEDMASMKPVPKAGV